MTVNASEAPAAVLFDMDGTIVDSEPYWMLAETELVAAHGGLWTHEQALSLVGLGMWDAASILQHAGADMTAEAIVERLASRVLEQIKVHVPWRVGARELIASIRQAKIPIALVTMSMRRMAQAVADDVGEPAFDVIVAGDEVAHPKPHPAPYLLAAERLGVDINRCVALEDSAPGVASASASGATTIAVPLHKPLGPDLSYTLWPSLEGRTIEHLREVFTARTTMVACVPSSEMGA